MGNKDEAYRHAEDFVGTHYCVQCFIDGMVEEGEPHKVELEIRGGSLRERPLHMDVTLKCPRCKKVQSHGTGLSEDEFDGAEEAWGGRSFDAFTSDIEQVDDEDLRALGYVV